MGINALGLRLRFSLNEIISRDRSSPVSLKGLKSTYQYQEGAAHP
jgi:hypothetical protein